MATYTDENEAPKLSQVFDDGMKIHLDLEESSECTNSKIYQVKFTIGLDAEFVKK